VELDTITDDVIDGRRRHTAPIESRHLLP